MIKFFVALAGSKDTQASNSHCRCYIKFLFNNSNISQGGIHVSLTSTVKQRTMTCKLYREASDFENARNERRKI